MILIELSINVDRETSKEHEQTDSNQKYEDLTGRLFHHLHLFDSSLTLKELMLQHKTTSILESFKDLRNE